MGASGFSAPRVTEELEVEIDQLGQIDIVEHDHVARREHLWILDGFVVALGRADQTQLDLLAQRPVRRTNQVTDVLQEHDVELIQIKVVQCPISFFSCRSFHILSMGRLAPPCQQDTDLGMDEV